MDPSKLQNFNSKRGQQLPQSLYRKNDKPPLGRSRAPRGQPSVCVDFRNAGNLKIGQRRKNTGSPNTRAPNVSSPSCRSPLLRLPFSLSRKQPSSLTSRERGPSRRRGCGVQGLGFRVWGSGFGEYRALPTESLLRAEALREPKQVLLSAFGFRLSDFGSRVSGFGFRVSGLGFMVSGVGSRV